MPLVLKTEGDSNGRKVLSVLGEIDIATVDALAEELTALGELDELVLDLTNTEFMDSSGLRLIIETNEKFAAAGGRFKVAVSGGPISRLLDVTGLRDQLDVHGSVEEATSG